jgi:hypothetical protein
MLLKAIAQALHYYEYKLQETLNKYIKIGGGERSTNL